MKITKKLKHRILTDNDFSLQLARVLKWKQHSMETRLKFEKGRGNARFRTAEAMWFYASQGIPESEILEKEPINQ